MKNMIKINNVKELFTPIFLSVINNGIKEVKKNVLYFLDLSKFHMYEQLLIEESLFRMCPILTKGKNSVGFVIVNDTTKFKESIKVETETSDNICQKKYANKSVILGVSGKVQDFIKDTNYVKQNNICLIKRFSGGGTVYVNKNSLIVSLILPHRFAEMTNYSHIKSSNNNSSNNSGSGSNSSNNNSSSSSSSSSSNSSNNSSSGSSNKNFNSNDTVNIPYKLCPSNITDWSFRSIYGKFMNNEENKNSLFTSNFGTLENDYVFKIYDPIKKNIIFKKVGGNAQAFSKHYFVHHSSFLWFCNFKEIGDILLNPKKQPIYRNKRQHSDFIESVQNCLNPEVNTPDIFIIKLISHMKKIISEMNGQIKTEKITQTQIESEKWVFTNLNYSSNENLSKYFDTNCLLDIQLLKEIYYLYNNDIATKKLRTTCFMDIQGNKVCDSYYRIPSILLS